MTFGRKTPGYRVSALACAVVFAGLALSPLASAQLPDLVVDVVDTTAAPGFQNSVISVYLSNYNDTVAGFNIWLQLDRPDIMIFQTNTDTIIDTSYWICNNWSGSDCLDSSQVDDTATVYDWTNIDTFIVETGNFDTTGTLCSGWEAIQARSLSGLGYDLNIIGLADYFTGGITPGIPPQSNGVLIKLLADVYNIPDTSTGTDRMVNIIVQHQFVDHFSFSRPDGSAIGLKDTVVQDTNWYVCTSWAGDVCLNWQRVSTPPADSFSVEDDTIAVIDYDNVIISNGSLTVLEGICGDANGDGDPDPKISDLTFMIAYLFRGGPAPSPLWVANVDCSDSDVPNVADLTYFIAALFRGGPLPCEGPNCVK